MVYHDKYQIGSSDLPGRIQNFSHTEFFLITTQTDPQFQTLFPAYVWIGYLLWQAFICTGPAYQKTSLRTLKRVMPPTMHFSCSQPQKPAPNNRCLISLFMVYTLEWIRKRVFSLFHTPGWCSISPHYS